MKKFAVLAAIGGFLAVLFGAFGAHGLAEHVQPRMLEVWQTAALYHMFHCITLLAISFNTNQTSTNYLHWACRLFVFGVIVFSGSLYLLVLTQIKILGMITPLGGMSLMLGWILLAYHMLKTAKADQSRD